MFKNIPLKIFSLLLATIFWIFVVSLENTFYKLPTEIPIQIFNRAENLALASPLGTAQLTIRTADPLALKNLSPNDFEAYVDVRNVGAGSTRVPVSVTSKNSQMSVIRVEPSEVELELEPVREKIVSVTPKVKGRLASGFRMESIKLLHETVTVFGAESLLKKIARGEVEIELSETEEESVAKKGTVKILGESGVLLEGLSIEPALIDAIITVSEVEGIKQVGVRAKITGALANGIVKKIEVAPAVISVTGSPDALGVLEVILTEEIALENFPPSGEKKVRLVLPEGVKLEDGEKGEVGVRVEIEKISNNQ